MNRAFLLLLFVFAPTANADELLYRLIHERLSWMKDVAAWKYQRKLPIENLSREAFVIEQATNTGLRQNVTTHSASAFFSAQIEAAKAIQSCWYMRWESSAEIPAPPDLNNEIRPKLITLGNQITERLLLHVADKQLFDTAVSLDCLPKKNAEDMFKALVSIERYPDRLTQVTASGQLRVGTTGDYAPFSYSEDNRTFTGIDIDLASDLAKHMGVKLVLVQTSWPELMHDLAGGHYDIAMSGVSRIPAREELAYFTEAYHVGGKTPISKCETAEQFSTLAQIDQPGVRLVVNPGGTNERFVRQNIRQADILMFDDNRDIFREIVSGNADLMITDRIEVQLQASREPTLCPTMPGRNLTYQEKAYMMPRDQRLRDVVDTWLSDVRTSGLLARTFDKHLK